MKNFKEWLKLKEIATTSADVAVFARPIGMVRRKKGKNVGLAEQDYSPIDAAIDIIQRKIADPRRDPNADISLSPIVLHPSDVKEIKNYYASEYDIEPVVSNLSSGKVVRSVVIKPARQKSIWGRIFGNT